MPRHLVFKKTNLLTYNYHAGMHGLKVQLGDYIAFICTQLLQKLNLMDYSLLVGIHDCTIQPADDDEFLEDYAEDDGNGYISSDEVMEAPLSPGAGIHYTIVISVDAVGGTNNSEL